MDYRDFKSFDLGSYVSTLPEMQDTKDTCSKENCNSGIGEGKYKTPEHSSLVINRKRKYCYSNDANLCSEKSTKNRDVGVCLDVRSTNQLISQEDDVSTNHEAKCEIEILGFGGCAVFFSASFVSWMILDSCGASA